jgi:hypothetical protein
MGWPPRAGPSRRRGRRGRAARRRRSAEGVLGEHGGVGVVGDEHRQRHLGAQSAFEVDALPAEVRRREHDAAVVHDAGAADADAEDRRVRVGHEATRELDDGARMSAGPPAPRRPDARRSRRRA